MKLSERINLITTDTMVLIEDNLIELVAIEDAITRDEAKAKIATPEFRKKLNKTANHFFQYLFRMVS